MTPHVYEKGGGVLLQHPMHERGADSTPSRGAGHQCSLCDRGGVNHSITSSKVARACALFEQLLFWFENFESCAVLYTFILVILSYDYTYENFAFIFILNIHIIYCII